MAIRVALGRFLLLQPFLMHALLQRYTLVLRPVCCSVGCESPQSLLLLLQSLLLLLQPLFGRSRFVEQGRSPSVASSAHPERRPSDVSSGLDYGN